MYKENAEKLVLKIKEADSIYQELFGIFEEISTQHREGGGHLEYAYLEHYLNESLDVSYLLQFIFSNSKAKRFIPVANRMLFEISLKIEYIIHLKKEEKDNEIMSLLSKDMASMMSALDEAVGSSDNNPAKDTLLKLNIINKILKTDFDLNKIKSNTPTFPKVKDMCNRSQICIKNYCGDKLWHYYVMWSWNNHSRLGNEFSLEKNSDYLLNNNIECFIELYVKNLKLLSNHANAKTQENKAIDLMKELGILLN